MFSFVQAAFRSALCAAALSLAVGVVGVQAQPADSDVCVMGRNIPGVGQPYYQHNAIIMAGYRELLNSFEIARMRNAPGAIASLRRLREALEDTPRLDRRLLGVVMEPPTYIDRNRSCARIPTPPTAGEYPLVFNTLSPRLIGEMCVQEPEIRFHIASTRAADVGVGVEIQDFYAPDFSAERPLAYAELDRQADRGLALPSIIRGLMGIRVAQCGDLPAAMRLVAVRDRQPIMTASLLILDDGIQILTQDDDTGRRLAEAQRRASEQYQARLSQGRNWEERAAVGAAIAITGLAIILMSRCNDRGSFGNTSLPDCE